MDAITVERAPLTFNLIACRADGSEIADHESNAVFKAFRYQTKKEFQRVKRPDRRPPWPEVTFWKVVARWDDHAYIHDAVENMAGMSHAGQMARRKELWAAIMANGNMPWNSAHLCRGHRVRSLSRDRRITAVVPYSWERVPWHEHPDRAHVLSEAARLSFELAKEGLWLGKVETAGTGINTGVQDPRIYLNLRVPKGSFFSGPNWKLAHRYVVEHALTNHSPLHMQVLSMLVKHASWREWGQVRRAAREAGYDIRRDKKVAGGYIIKEVATKGESS